MKFNKTFQTIVSLIIVVTLIIPLSTTKKTEARTVGFGATNYTGNTGNSSLSGIIGNLSPLIKQLPGCTSTLKTGTGNLFSGIKNIFKSKETKEAELNEKARFKIEDIAIDNIAEEEAVETYDANANKKLDTVAAKQDELLSVSKKTEKSVTSDNQNNTCLNSIGKAVIKTIVDKMTVSIVNWINTGNSGDSFFVKNPSQYFKDIAKNQILSFGEELKDSVKYPFAKNFMLNAANSFNNTFQQNAQYSLNKTLNGQQESFFNDFSQGGWGAWDALTQNPANNPLGFAIMASNELQARIANETTEKTQELTQSGGFLNQEKCVDPEGVTKEEDESARNAGGRYLDAQGTNVAGGRYIDEQGTNTQARICKKWETVTPGQTIASKLTKSMNNSEDALLSADTLNDAIGAILDAALAKLSSTLTNEGLAAISENDISTSYDSSNYEDSGLADYQTSQTETDFSSYQRDSSPWLQSHPNFDIRTDITQALIDEQKTYIDKLKALNYALMHTDSSTFSGYNGLIPTIYQLDYCIPGPHPGWEEDAQNEINKIVDQAGTLSQFGIEDTAGYSLLNTFTLGIGTAIIEFVNSYAFPCNGDTGSATLSDALGNIVANFIGAGNIIGSNNSALCTVGGFQDIIQRIFDSYVPIMAKHYNTKTLPSVAKEAETKFNKISGYRKMIQDNEDAMAFQEGIIKRLENIKANVEALNPNSPTYENDLVIWKNSFARISVSLVSGGDIAYVDSLAKQAEDERVYILNDLLQGPAGCEKELMSTQTPLMYWDTTHNWMDWYNVRPRPYPYELLYMISPTGYNYYNTLHNVPQTISPGKFYPEGFLTAVTYYDACMLGEDWKAHAHYTDWYSEVIYLSHSPECKGNILNTKSPGIGGNTTYLERYLKIY